MLSQIIVYSQPGCGPCIAVTRHLRKAGVGFEVRDVRADETAAAEVARLGYQGTPVVVAGDMHTHGYRMDWLDQVIAAVQAENPSEHIDAELAAIEECAA